MICLKIWTEKGKRKERGKKLKNSDKNAPPPQYPKYAYGINQTYMYQTLPVS